MSPCERFEAAIAALLAGETEGLDGPALAHCRTCDACRELVELHRDLAALASSVPEPERADWGAMRGRVLRRVESATTADVRSAERRLFAGPWQVSIRPLRFAAGLAAALLMFAAGVWIGGAAGRSGEALASGPGAVTERLVRAIGTEAASNRVLADVEDSPFIYSNVSFRRAAEDLVTVDFDVTTHVQLVESVQSELLQELLVQSLVSRSPTGTRLKAIAYAADSMAPKVVQALIFALRRDESLAVRLQALTMLSARLDDLEVEEAVLATLRDDEAVQMRLLALEFLAEHSVDRDRLRQAIETSERPNGQALMVRLTQFDKL